MQVLFASIDINEDNLKVRAGHPLPARFQQSYMTLRSLRESFGHDAIIPFNTDDTQGYVLVQADKIATLEKENAQLKQQLAERVSKPGQIGKAGGDKRETQ